MKAEEFVVRRLESIEEFRVAEEAQRVIWGIHDDTEVVPLHALVTAQKNGGLVLGAFDGDKMVGYLFGFLGRTPEGKDKHCSHMMGVFSKHRGQGIGEALKRRQQEFVLDQGLDLITWTYDPLESRNAYLNIRKLGAVCRTYLRNVYGEMQDSLNVGLPTDRFEAEWWIRSPRVESRCSKKAPSPPATLDDLLSQGAAVVNEVERDSAGLPTTLSWAPHRGSTVLVEIPPNFQEVKQANIKLARDWRLLTRALFEEYFENAYVVVDFVSEVEGGRRRSFYVLEHQPDLSDGEGPARLTVDERAAIQAGMDLYNAGEYWECHEVLEEVWLEARPEDKLFLQGLIQASAAFHKYVVQKNAVGAVKLLNRALNKLTRYSDDYMGLDMGLFKRGLSTCWRQVIDLGQRHIEEFDAALVPALRWVEGRDA
ncbi:MAG: GNAT family N-acetyltransferase [Anaerolineae bacterium]